MNSLTKKETIDRIKYTLYNPAYDRNLLVLNVPNYLIDRVDRDRLCMKSFDEGVEIGFLYGLVLAFDLKKEELL